MVIPLDIEARLWPSEELCRLAGAGQGRRVRDVTNGISKPFESIVDEICELNPGSTGHDSCFRLAAASYLSAWLKDSNDSGCKRD